MLSVVLLFIHSTYKIQCPFTICVGVTEDGEKFCVKKVINEHNHAIDKVNLFFSYIKVLVFC